MITFSERQLKFPQISKPVYLIAGGMSKFGSTDIPMKSHFKLNQKEA